MNVGDLLGSGLVGKRAGRATGLTRGIGALGGIFAALVVRALVDKEKVKALVTAASGACIASVLAGMLGVAIHGSRRRRRNAGDAVSDEFHSVVASEASALVSGVNTRLVVEEVFVNGKSDGDRAVGDKLGLEGILANVVAPVAVLVLGELVGGSGASGGASRHGSVPGLVGFASQGDNTGADQVVGGVSGPAATAAHVVSGVAGNEVLSGHVKVDGALGGNGKAISESLGGAESPAAAALALVLNTVDETGPLRARVKLGGQVLDGGGGNVVGAVHGVGGELHTEQAVSLGTGDTLKALVGASGPSAGLGIDGFDHLRVVDGQGAVILHGNRAGNGAQNKNGDGNTHFDF